MAAQEHGLPAMGREARGSPRMPWSEPLPARAFPALLAVFPRARTPKAPGVRGEEGFCLDLSRDLDGGHA